MKKTKLTEGFFVKMKSLKELKKFGRHLGGDMSEALSYFIKFGGELMERTEDPNCNFNCFTKHVLDNGEEFLVIDHPNIITKREYEDSKALYTEVEDTQRSVKGVY